MNMPKYLQSILGSAAFAVQVQHDASWDFVLLAGQI